MSLRSENIMSLAGLDYSKKSEDNLREMFGNYLKNGIHGICFSSYTEEQGPGSVIKSGQIRERISIIKPYIKWVRTFSCTDGNELIPVIAKENGLKVLAGAWLSDNREKNEEEIRNLIALAKEG